MKSCPHCGGTNVRRSEAQTSDAAHQQMLLSPYRCRACRTRFWVVSRKTHVVGRALGVALLTLALSWGLWSGMVYIASLSHDVVAGELSP